MSARKAAELGGGVVQSSLHTTTNHSRFVVIQMQHDFLKNIQQRQKDKTKPHISTQFKMEIFYTWFLQTSDFHPWHRTFSNAGGKWQAPHLIYCSTQTRTLTLRSHFARSIFARRRDWEAGRILRLRRGGGNINAHRWEVEKARNMAAVRSHFFKTPSSFKCRWKIL